MRYVGLIRNVMVGREGLGRDVLLQLVGQAGASNGSSHLATGNLIFDVPPPELPAVVQRLETGIKLILGRREPVIVRGAAELVAFVAADPFQPFPVAEWERTVAFLEAGASPLDATELAAVDGLTVVDVRPHELLTVNRREISRGGPYALLALERRRQATTRSWGTLERLASRV
jgi:uncharacterized protein (DUF1697 family)